VSLGKEGFKISTLSTKDWMDEEEVNTDVAFTTSESSQSTSKGDSSEPPSEPYRSDDPISTSPKDCLVLCLFAPPGSADWSLTVREELVPKELSLVLISHSSLPCTDPLEDSKRSEDEYEVIEKVAIFTSSEKRPNY